MSGNDEFPKVDQTGLRALLVHHFKQDEPLCILAMPGVGKSQIVSQASQEVFGVLPHVLIGSVMQPADYMGWAWMDTERRVMTYYPLDGSLFPCKAPGCLFLDEISSAPIMNQSASLQLMDKSRKAGSSYCPPGVGRVAAGNRVSDKAGAGRLISAMSNRCTVVELVATLEGWKPWALANNINPWVLAYLKLHERDKKSALVDWDSNRTINATPRAWEAVSRLLESCPEDLIETMVSGRVGVGHGASFMGFYKLRGALPDPDDVLRAPQDAVVFKTREANWMAKTFALIGALAQRASPKTASAIITYAARLDAEFGMCLIEDARAVNEVAITGCVDYQRWVVAHPELYR